MKNLTMAAIVMMGLLPVCCLAQTPPCGSGGIPLTPTGSAAPFLSIAPSPPLGGLPLRLAAGLTNFQSQSVRVSGVFPYLDVTVTGKYLTFGTPPGLQCATATLGPLVTASYSIRFYVQDATVPGSPPTLVGTGTLNAGIGISVDVSNVGTTVLGYATPLTPTCYAAGTTSISVSGGDINLSTDMIRQSCFILPPTALPPTAIADVGYLTAGTYQVRWSLTYSPPYPPGGEPPIPVATTSFVIAADQVSVPVPTLTPIALALLVAACVGLGLARLRPPYT